MTSTLVVKSTLYMTVTILIRRCSEGIH